MVSIKSTLGSAGGHLLSVLTRNPVVLSYPASVSIELSRRCNLNCTHCIRRESLRRGNSQGDMEIDLLTKIMSEMRHRLSSVYLYFQGESLLHPGFEDCMKICSGTKRVLSTNGILLRDRMEVLMREPPETLIVSIDDLRGERVYRKNVSAGLVFDMVQELAVKRNETGMKHPRIVVQTLVHQHNETDLGELRKRSLHSGADSHYFKSMLIPDFSQIGDWQPRSGRYRRYIQGGDGRYRTKKAYGWGCFRAWYHPVITWEGYVLPCCFDKTQEYILGNLRKNTFRDIWFSKKYMLFRKRLLRRPGRMAMCRNCTSGLMPWIRR